MAADLHFGELYEQLCQQLSQFGVHLPPTPTACRLWQMDAHMGRAKTFRECEFAHTSLKESLMCDEIDSSQHLGGMVPPWYDLSEIQNPNSGLAHEVAVLAQLVTLHKWRLHLIYQYVNFRSSEI